MSADPAVAALIEAASAPYRRAGRFAWHFARGKLRGDPAFAAILREGLLTGSTCVLDLGCGQGLLAAWLQAAAVARRAGSWPRDWPPPPDPARLTGVDVNASEVARARAALGAAGQFVHGDIRHVDYGPADAIVILDVLHFIDYAAQEAVLRRARAALGAHGVLLMRVADAEAGLGFLLSTLVDRLVALARRRRLLKLFCRPVREWRALLTQLGFETRSLPMSAGTPFANVLLVGRLP
ncbi:MAG TPA: class I SAM-dependent methyltransferase [Steroidobacteraceae bacterium]|nr:class I SAM-dependent methyltransferase [Gammaproteobacteria bacterium]HEV2286294.1 class I SAM-dependent methyltransferase [Steroidobacteraceae bacterium]